MTKKVNNNTKKQIKDAKTENVDEFSKPQLISEELCNFLGKSKGSMISRIEVTKHITDYIKKYNLQDPDEINIFKPDKKLKELFKVNENDGINYYSLQKHIQHHFSEENPDVSKPDVEEVTEEKNLPPIKKTKKGVRKSSDSENIGGFTKPVEISEELCKFLGKSKGTLVSRVEVTKHITNYIKKNNLQDPDNKRIIKPDKKLKELLNLSDNDQLTYYNLQKNIQSLFIRKPKI